MSQCVSVALGKAERCCITFGKAANAGVLLGSQERCKVTCVTNGKADVRWKLQMATITYGFMCGVNLGAAVLCGSDGALITIDGKYLIVRQR